MKEILLRIKVLSNLNSNKTGFLFLFFLLLFSCWVVSNSLPPHGLQHARFPFPSLSLRVCSNSCPLSQWCYRTILSFVLLDWLKLCWEDQNQLAFWLTLHIWKNTKLKERFFCIYILLLFITFYYSLAFLKSRPDL